jgi:hypothetical protein
MGVGLTTLAANHRLLQIRLPLAICRYIFFRLPIMINGFGSQFSIVCETIAASHPQFRLINSRRIELSIFITIMSVLALSLSACDVLGDEEPSLNGTDVAMKDIAGNWSASQAYFRPEPINQNTSIDLIAAGITFSIEIQDNGRFVLSEADAAGGASPSSGQLGFDGEWLVVAFDDSPSDPDYFTVNFTDDILNISGPGEFDIDEDSSDDSGIIEFYFERS